METRKCSKCGERKPINKFYKKGFNKQGIQQYAGTCRLCQTEYHAKYYAAKKDKIAEAYAVNRKSLQTQTKNGCSQPSAAQ